MPQVCPGGWSQEQAERLQEAHRELLRAVKDKPVGTEAGAVYTPDMQLVECRIGEDGNYQVPMPRYSAPYVFIHNHPSGLTFSAGDIENFGKNFDLETLTAVGNTGSVYILQKTDQYNPVGFAKAFLLEQITLTQTNTPQEYADEIVRYLKEAKRYGIQFIAGR